MYYSNYLDLSSFGDKIIEKKLKTNKRQKPEKRTNKGNAKNK